MELNKAKKPWWMKDLTNTTNTKYNHLSWAQHWLHTFKQVLFTKCLWRAFLTCGALILSIPQLLLQVYLVLPYNFFWMNIKKRLFSKVNLVCINAFTIHFLIKLFIDKPILAKLASKNWHFYIVRMAWKWQYHTDWYELNTTKLVFFVPF